MLGIDDHRDRRPGPNELAAPGGQHLHDAGHRRAELGIVEPRRGGDGVGPRAAHARFRGGDRAPGGRDRVHAGFRAREIRLGRGDFLAPRRDDRLLRVERVHRAFHVGR